MMKKEEVTNIFQKKILSVFLFQTLLLFLAFFFLYSSLKINVVSKTFYIQDVSYIYYSIGLFFVFFLLEIFYTKKNPYYRELSRQLTLFWKFIIKSKILKAKYEPRIILLIAIEIFFVVFIAYSIYVFLDPEAEFLGFIEFKGLNEYEKTVVKVAIFVATILFIHYAYKRTAEFRKYYAEKSPLQRKIESIKKRFL